jgi:hypothetical protein
MTVAESEAEFKAREHRRARRTTRALLNGFVVHDASEEPNPPEKAFGNPWAGPKDGKQYLQTPNDKLMRK